MHFPRPNEATQVFLMGVGDAYLGLVDLLSHNGEQIFQSNATGGMLTDRP
jgi:hypothetical protein